MTGFSVIQFIRPWTGSFDNALIVSVTLGLLLGFVKGRTVLKKTALRQAKAIRTAPNPAKITTLFNKRYLLLIAAMMGLGMIMRILPISADTRGLIDLTIGAGLINGAMNYLRIGMDIKREPTL